MSFGSLSAPAKEALGRGASIAGTLMTTGDGGMARRKCATPRRWSIRYSRSATGDLIDQRLGVAPLFRRHAAVAVVVDVPAMDAPRPSASLAGADNEPKLIPAIVTGIFSVIGFFAWRVPSVTSVPQRSR